MALDLIIFDWDGTLMDSQAKIVHAMQAAFATQGLEPPAQTAVSSIIGLSLEEAVFRLAPHCSLSDRTRLAANYRSSFHDSMVSAELFAGVIATLDFCLGQGFELAIATGKSHAGLMHALEETGVSSYFNCIRTADRCRSKPSPEMVEEILLETGIEPNAALLIGDTSHDLQMAANAGIAAGAACYGAHSRQALAEHQPLFYLDSIDELPANLPALVEDNQ